MKKTLLGLICGLLVVGVANMGYSLGFFGGSNKNTPAGSSQDDATSTIQFDFDFINCGNGESGSTAPNTAPVSDPSTMILLGSVLIGLSGCGKKKLTK